MLARYPFRCLIAAGALAFASTVSYADFPDKQITLVVPFAAGSATDQLARALGQELAQLTKQPTVVDNRPGASGFIAAQLVAKAPTDGYTVFVTTNTTQAANEHLYKKLPYDPVKDFAPVTALGRGGQIMIVNPDVPAKTVLEFIAYAKSKPGRMRKIVGNQHAKWRKSNCQRAKAIAASAVVAKRKRKPGNWLSMKANHGATIRMKRRRLVQWSNGRKRSRASREKTVRQIMVPPTARSGAMPLVSNARAMPNQKPANQRRRNFWC